MSSLQRTLRSSLRFSGIGLHSGVQVDVEIRPAAAGSGILFQRVDLPHQPYIPATPANVLDTLLATRLGTPEAHISTVEHLMAAFFGFGIDNAVVAVNNYELPIVDGSAAPFLVMLDEVGIQELSAPRKVLVVKKTVEVVDPNDPTRFVRIEPSSQPWLSYAIDFENAGAIGKQQVSMPLSGQAFCEEFAFARTFCLEDQVNLMRSRGLALGGSLANAVVVNRNHGILNTKGLRTSDEFVRHKALDCVGDLALCGHAIIGHVIANKAGHDLHTQVARRLLADAQTHEVQSMASKSARAWADLIRFPESLAAIQRPLASGLAIG